MDQTTAAIRKEKEAYEAMHGSLELRSLRDDDRVRINSLRRAMLGSPETSQGVGEDSLAIDREAAQVQQPITRGTQRSATPPPGSFAVLGTSCERDGLEIRNRKQRTGHRSS